MYNGIKLFADGADYDDIIRLNEDERIDGFTTNPTLLRKAGVDDYESFAKSVLTKIKDKPISFEVFDDSLDGMINQALYISKWGDNVYVKIPVTNTKGVDTCSIMGYLSKKEIKINATAIFTSKQAEKILRFLCPRTNAIISVFAGRIANTLENPMDTISYLHRNYSNPRHEILWASTRELYNIMQAEKIGCEIITVTYDVIKKMKNIGKDLNQFSQETVQMFYKDAKESGFKI